MSREPIKLLLPEDQGGEGHEIEGSATLAGAVKTVIIADFVMSLDNVIGVAGAAKGNFTLLIFGLVVSIPLVVVGSKLILRALDRFPAIIVFGGALLGWIAGELIATDPLSAPHLAGLPGWSHYAFSAAGALVVVAVARWLLRRQAARRDSREAG